MLYICVTLSGACADVHPDLSARFYWEMMVKPVFISL